MAASHSASPSAPASAAASASAVKPTKHRAKKTRAPPPPPPAGMAAEGAAAGTLGGRAAVDPRRERVQCQRLVSAVCATFASVRAEPDYAARLAQIKTHFYDRAFDRIFLDPALVPVYAASYSPARALGYRDLLLDSPVLRVIVAAGGRVCALGAGSGGEVMAFAGALTTLREDAAVAAVTATAEAVSPASPAPSIPATPIDLVLQDFGPYQSAVALMQAALPSQFGLTPTALQVQFIQSDLVADPLPLGPAAGTDPATPPCRLLITAFVLNELLALQKAHFHRVVRHVLTQLPADAHWLVVDAASSFSDVAIAGRAYRVHHLLDHIPQLDCVEARDSHWYRFPKGLQSPDPLQNMRYWMRLYRRKAA